MRKLALTATVLVGLGMALRAAPSANPAPEHPRGRLVLGLRAPERVAVVDVRSGRTVSRRVPGGTLCRRLLVTGRRLVFARTSSRGATAVAIGLGLKGRPRRLGGVWDFFPSAQPGRVWLATLRRRWDAFRSLREVAVDGRTAAVAHQRSPGVNVEGALEDGLLIERRGRLSVWNPRSGRVVRRIAAPYALAARGRQVAWCRGRCRTLHVTGPGGEITLAAPASLVSGGDFSPDGSLLALPLGDNRIAVVDVAARSMHTVPGARLTGYAAMAWAPSGRRLYFAARRRLLAYRLGDDRPIVLRARPRGTVLQLLAAT